MNIVYSPIKNRKNNHSINKTRVMLPEEKKYIKKVFVRANGLVPEDLCKDIHKKLGPDISIFQVVGYVSYLHAQVQQKSKFLNSNLKKLSIKNRQQYEKFIKAHRKKWSTYKSFKYSDKSSVFKRDVKWTPLLRNRCGWIIPKESETCNNIYNFWKFFKDNYNDIETILWSISNRYANRIDPDDMHEELILRLQRNDFLKDFDPLKSQLNTYLTNKCLGYARHILTEELKEPKKIRLETLNPKKSFYEYGGEEKKEVLEAPVQSLLYHSSIEDDITVTELVILIRKQLTPSMRTIFDLKIKGWKNKEVAESLEISISHVCNLLHCMREHVRRILNA